MYGPHVFIVKSIINAREALISAISSEDLEFFDLSSESKYAKKLSRWMSYVKLGSFFGVGNYKTFRVFSKDRYTYIVPTYKISYIDNDYSQEAQSLSHYIQDDLFYVWTEHATNGLKIYRQGKCQKSIVDQTHGPGIEVDGKQVDPALFILRKTLKQENFNNLQWVDRTSAGDILLFVQKGLSVDINKLKKEITKAPFHALMSWYKLVVVLLIILVMLKSCFSK